MNFEGNSIIENDLLVKFRSSLKELEDQFHGLVMNNGKIVNGKDL